MKRLTFRPIAAGPRALTLASMLPACAACAETPGVDPIARVVTLGTLSTSHDEIEIALVDGKRLAARWANEDGAVLPEGWRVELLERWIPPHRYAVREAYDAMRSEVALLHTTFGGSLLFDLFARLQRDGRLLFPYSKMERVARNAATPMAGAPSTAEATRVVEWAAAAARAAGVEMRLGMLTHRHTYGKEIVDAVIDVAARVKILVPALAWLPPEVEPGGADLAAPVAELAGADVTHVLLGTLSSWTPAVFAAAAALDFRPVWLGLTSSFTDAAPGRLPHACWPEEEAQYRMPGLPVEGLEGIADEWDHFFLATSFLHLGQDDEGLRTFRDAYERFGEGLAPPSMEMVWSFGQALLELEVVRRALEAGDASPAGLRVALRSIDGWTGGPLPPLRFATPGGLPSTDVQVLAIDPWTGAHATLSPLASPESLR